MRSLTDVLILLHCTASIDLDECISRLYKKELLAESVVEAICAKTKELLMKESNVVHIAAPVTVVGDIHGQFFDLIEIFRIGGFCPDTNYLFLGRLCIHFFQSLQKKLASTKEQTDIFYLSGNIIIMHFLDDKRHKPTSPYNEEAKH